MLRRVEPDAELTIEEVVVELSIAELEVLTRAVAALGRRVDVPAMAEVLGVDAAVERALHLELLGVRGHRPQDPARGIVRDPAHVPAAGAMLVALSPLALLVVANALANLEHDVDALELGSIVGAEPDEVGTVERALRAVVDGRATAARRPASSSPERAMEVPEAAVLRDLPGVVVDDDAPPGRMRVEAYANDGAVVALEWDETEHAASVRWLVDGAVRRASLLRGVIRVAIHAERHGTVRIAVETPHEGMLERLVLTVGEDVRVVEVPLHA